VTAPDAGRAPAPDQHQPATLRIVAESQELTPTGTGGHVIGAEDFLRAQLPMRFDQIILDASGLQRSEAWWQFLVHACTGHLLPGASLRAVYADGDRPDGAALGELVTKLAESTGLVATEIADSVTETSGGRGSDEADAAPSWRRTSRRTVHDLVADARSNLDRVSPDQLALLMADPTVIVLDTRTPTDREVDGIIAGSHHVPRTVLEWVVDPASGYSEDFEGASRLVVVCNEGYSSSLAACTLQDLGFAAATDLIGGMQAWRASGHPTVSPTVHHCRCLLPEDAGTSHGFDGGDAPPT